MSNQRIANSFVDAGPFRSIIERWLEVAEKDWAVQLDAGDANPHPSVTLCETLWPHLKMESAKRRLSELRSRSTHIHFDLADRIVCKLLGRAELWLTDPVLNAIYEDTSLLAVDLAYPTCFGAAADACEIIRDAFKACDGSRNATAQMLGISHTRVSAVVGFAREEVAA